MFATMIKIDKKIYLHVDSSSYVIIFYSLCDNGSFPLITPLMRRSISLIGKYISNMFFSYICYKIHVLEISFSIITVYQHEMMLSKLKQNWTNALKRGQVVTMYNQPSPPPPPPPHPMHSLHSVQSKDTARVLQFRLDIKSLIYILSSSRWE